MLYPSLKPLPVQREITDVFKGYNHNLRIGEGEFYDMKNLSSDNFPVLSPRCKRGIYASPDAPQAMVAKDSLCYVDGGKFYINSPPIVDSKMELGVGCESCPNKGACTKYKADNYRTTLCEKTLVSMGAYVIIMPDKKYINTSDLTDCGDIEASFTTSTIVRFTLCRADGSEYSNAVPQTTAPTDPKSGDLWIDTSSTPHTLKQWSASAAMWTPITTTYVKINGGGKTGLEGIGLHFAEGDGVTISGITVSALADLNGSTVISARKTGYIVVPGILDQETEQDTPVTVTRTMPNMDFVIESGNRLWGCRYGTAVNGEVVNEIYASKLGDFKNWNCFAGISTDSYAASVGTDGQFTGAITHMGYPLFFKENFVHKVYGNYPANFQIQTTACRGVQKGCEKSLAIVNETLYYKSRSAICAYDGSLPVETSAALGDVAYFDAAAGALGNKYYISMADASGKYHLFVYDAMKGMWHREDDTQAVQFCNCQGELYFIDYADKQIKTVRGTGVTETTPLRWEAITGLIGTDSPDKKYISRMEVRMKLSVGTKVSFYAEYDSSETWEHLFTMTGINLRSFAVPIRPKRCDHMRLRIVGTGDAKVFSICKSTEQGSDV